MEVLEQKVAGSELPAPADAWTAVETRDRRYDGAFVYAVKTTGVYCRPSCPSRHALRRNVDFYPSPAAAEDAGFRACRRCHPDEEAGTPAEQAVERARVYLDQRLDETVTLETLAAAVGLSPSHLQRTFTRLVGLSPREYQNRRRLETWKQRVRKGDTVLDATFEAGFGSSRGLYDEAKNGLGMTPGTYRRGGEGLHIRYTILDSSFGRVLVAATERGVCAVFLDDDDRVLEQALEGEYPRAAALECDDRGLRAWARPVIDYLEGTHAHPAAPLDLQGTDFQRRVWQVLGTIPYGETRTYSDVAEALGRPSAVRAVARACATNNAALVVPCHRVVRKGGELGGYRWGLERKRRLLELEGQG